MHVFLDSSAFAKRYIEESGTAEVISWCDQATRLGLSIIAIPELISAFCRLRREGALTASQYRRIKGDLFADIADALICDTNPDVIQLAIRALERHTLHGMDAIHIGAALASGAEVFVSADARQCAAAEALGLKVVVLR